MTNYENKIYRELVLVLALIYGVIQFLFNYHSFRYLSSISPIILSLASIIILTTSVYYIIQFYKETKSFSVGED